MCQRTNAGRVLSLPSAVVRFETYEDGKKTMAKIEAKCPECGGLYGTHANCSSSDDQAQKPDASPREWWVKEHRSGRNISNKLDLFTAVQEKPQNPGWIHVIEKSAYDALAKRVERAEDYVVACASHVESVRLVDDLAAAKARVAELERIHDGCSSLAIRLDAASASYQKQVDINQKLVSELAASKAENIGNLQLIGGMDERIKELEADNLLALGIADKFANERDEMKEREQKLVAIIEKMYITASPNDKGHSPRNTASQILGIYFDEFCSLKAHTASAEKGGA